MTQKNQKQQVNKSHAHIFARAPGAAGGRSGQDSRGWWTHRGPQRPRGAQGGRSTRARQSWHWCHLCLGRRRTGALWDLCPTQGGAQSTWWQQPGGRRPSQHLFLSRLPLGQAQEEAGWHGKGPHSPRRPQPGAKVSTWGRSQGDTEALTRSRPQTCHPSWKEEGCSHSSCEYNRRVWRRPTRTAHPWSPLSKCRMGTDSLRRDLRCTSGVRSGSSRGGAASGARS